MLTLLRRRALTYLLHATFSTDQAAPLPASLPVDVGGPLAVTDTGSFASVSGGKLISSSATADHNPRAESPALTRRAGLTVIKTVTKPGSTNRQWFGWWVSSASIVALFDEGSSGGSGGVYPSTGSLVAGPITLAAATSYQLMVILRATGAFFLVKGGVYTAWTLVWVDAAGSSTPVKAVISQVAAAVLSADDLRVLDLASFATDTQVYTSRLASPAAGATTTSTADALIETTFTHSAVNRDLDIRRVDDNNCFRIRAASDNTLYLADRVGGVQTVRASSASAFTVGVAARVVCVAEGNVYKVYVNNVLKFTYTDTSNLYNTQTGVKITGGAVDEIICWPRTLTLPSGV